MRKTVTNCSSHFARKTFRRKIDFPECGMEQNELIRCGDDTNGIRVHSHSHLEGTEVPTENTLLIPSFFSILFRSKERIEMM